MKRTTFTITALAATLIASACGTPYNPNNTLNMFVRADANGDEFLDYDEYTAMVQHKADGGDIWAKKTLAISPEDADSFLAQRFKELDTDNDGKLSPKETDVYR